MRKSKTREVSVKVMELCSEMKYPEALELIKKYKVRGLSVTKATLKSKYGLKPKDIEKLHYIEVDNRLYATVPMRLYLRAEAYCLSLKIKRSKTTKNKIL